MGKIYTSMGLMSGTSLDGVDVSIIKSDGNKELMSDEFRTAGTSDKVDSKHGLDMRECIIRKVSEKAKK